MVLGQRGQEAAEDAGDQVEAVHHGQVAEQLGPLVCTLLPLAPEYGECERVPGQAQQNHGEEDVDVHGLHEEWVVDGADKWGQSGRRYEYDVVAAAVVVVGCCEAGSCCCCDSRGEGTTH